MYVCVVCAFLCSRIKLQFNFLYYFTSKVTSLQVCFTMALMAICLALILRLCTLSVLTLLGVVLVQQQAAGTIRWVWLRGSQIH